MSTQEALDIDAHTLDSMDAVLFKLRCVAENPSCAVSYCGSTVLAQQLDTVAQQLAHLDDLVDVYCLGGRGTTE